MAYYTYKSVRDSIPPEFSDKWCEDKGIDIDELYDDEAYNWDLWLMVADYIHSLQAKIEG